MTAKHSDCADTGEKPPGGCDSVAYGQASGRPSSNQSRKIWNGTLNGAPGLSRGAALSRRFLSDGCRPGRATTVFTCFPFCPTQLLPLVSPYCVLESPIERHPCLLLAHTTVGLK